MTASMGDTLEIRAQLMRTLRAEFGKQENRDIKTQELSTKTIEFLTALTKGNKRASPTLQSFLPGSGRVTLEQDKITRSHLEFQHKSLIWQKKSLEIWQEMLHLAKMDKDTTGTSHGTGRGLLPTVAKGAGSVLGSVAKAIGRTLASVSSMVLKFAKSPVGRVMGGIGGMILSEQGIANTKENAGLSDGNVSSILEAAGGGAMAGAALGSFFGPVGTVVGGVAGALVQGGRALFKAYHKVIMDTLDKLEKGFMSAVVSFEDWADKTAKEMITKSSDWLEDAQQSILEKVIPGYHRPSKADLDKAKDRAQKAQSEQDKLDREEARNRRRHQENPINRAPNLPEDRPGTHMLAWEPSKPSSNSDYTIDSLSIGTLTVGSMKSNMASASNSLVTNAAWETPDSNASNQGAPGGQMQFKGLLGYVQSNNPGIWAMLLDLLGVGGGSLTEFKNKAFAAARRKWDQMTGGNGGEKHYSVGENDDPTFSVDKLNNTSKDFISTIGKYSDNPDRDSKFAYRESSFDPNRKNGAGGKAQGGYQFMPGTWQQYYDIAKQDNPDLVNNPNDPRSATIVEDTMMKASAKILTDNGIEVNDKNQYIMHMMGMDGGLKFLLKVKNKDQGDPTKDFPDASKYNRSFFGSGKTNGDGDYTYDQADSKFGSWMGKAPDFATASGQSGTNMASAKAAPTNKIKMPPPFNEQQALAYAEKTGNASDAAVNYALKNPKFMQKLMLAARGGQAGMQGQNKLDEMNRATMTPAAFVGATPAPQFPGIDDIPMFIHDNGMAYSHKLTSA